MIAIVCLVVLTAGTVGYLGYRNIAAVAVPRTLARIDAAVQARAADLANLVNQARADVRGFRRSIGLERIVALSSAPAANSAEGQTLADWRARLGTRFVEELNAKPGYDQFRIIGVADGGREIVRVERLGDGSGSRIVPDGELQRKGDRGYFIESHDAAEGAILVSAVELNRESGSISVPATPVIRVSTPIFTPDGTRFGLLIINLDLRGAFKRLTDPTNPDATLYAINDRGDYLSHPDPKREFGFEFGTPFRIQDDFPGLAAAIATGDQQSEILENRAGQRFGVALAPVRLAGGAPLSVVEAIAEDKIVNVGLVAWRNSSLLGGLIAVLGAIVLGMFLARSMVKPLSEMTQAVAGFSADATLNVPVKAGGEIGVLARAFKQMTEEVGAKNAAIRHEKEIFENIMTAMAECVVLIDLDGSVVYHNRANQDLLASLNMTAAEWRELYDLYSEDGTTQLSREQWPSARALRGEIVDNYEIVCRRRDSGETIHLTGSARPLRDGSGNQTGAVVVFRDVTEQRATERKLHQSQKLEAIGQLTGGVAHDFNNMLTVITGTAEVLIEDLEVDRPNLAGLVRMIAQAADRGAELTRHLLAFARRQPLQPANVDVNAMITSTTKMLLPTLGEQIEIQSMLEEGVSSARIDPSQLSAALLNLAVNARDAMPHGGKLLLETGNVVLDESYAQHNAEVRPGSYVMIAVSDTGTGIPAQLRDKVFDPFFTTKEVGKGTGLGLSMVYGFVKQSNGHIKIYSEEGHGTTIKMYLPCAEAEAAAAATLADPIEGGSETILVVEDDALLRNFVVAQLQSLGYRTLAAADGGDALAIVDGGAPFDLLFTDVIIPGMNGRQLAEAIAVRRPLRVLYTSGYTENAIVHHGRLDAGVLLLPKPYRKLELAQMVRSALDSAEVTTIPAVDPQLRAVG